MTHEGRLKRGKENFEHKNLDGSVGKFLNNPETLEYLESQKGKPKSEEKKKDDKPNK